MTPRCRAFALAVSGLAAFACGGADSAGGGATTPAVSTSEATDTSDPSAAPTAAGPPLVVVAMKLSIPKVKPTELKADGSVVVDGKLVAKFVGADLQTKDGKAMLSVAADGSITNASGRDAKFNAKDELEIGGGKISVGDDGVVKIIKPDGTPDKDSGMVSFTGFKPAARRAATVLVIAMLAASASH